MVYLMIKEISPSADEVTCSYAKFLVFYICMVLVFDLCVKNSDYDCSISLIL